jgi:hypothetical protein
MKISTISKLILAGALMLATGAFFPSFAQHGERGGSRHDNGRAMGHFAGDGGHHTSSRQRAHFSGGRFDRGYYDDHFGSEHNFHFNAVRYGSGYRFYNGGFWFGFDGYPLGWAYGDPTYIIEEDGSYYVVDSLYPTRRFAVNVVI